MEDDPANAAQRVAEGKGAASNRSCRVVDVQQVPISDFQWLEAQKITYENDGKKMFWESVVRTTRSGASDGVACLALTKSRTEEEKLVLVSQFRPPLGKCCLELPAGLCDEGEAVTDTALRELKEETGYSGRIRHVSPVVAGEPGMTNNSLVFVTVDVDLDAPENANPKPSPEVTEGQMKQHLISLPHFHTQLGSLAQKHGFAIDCKVFGIAVGICLYKEWHAVKLFSSIQPGRPSGTGLPRLPPRRQPVVQQQAAAPLPKPPGWGAWIKWLDKPQVQLSIVFICGISVGILMRR